MSIVRFAAPWALLFLLAIPGLLAVTRGRRVGRGVLVLRALLFVLLILSLAGPQVALRGTGLTVMFAMDQI